MDLFIDSASTQEISAWAETGLVTGVTTNPTLLAKSGRPVHEVLKEICALIDGPISAEVTASDWGTMLREAEVLRAIHDNIVIKVPLTKDGLKACYHLVRREIPVNVTLCFSAAQALMAAQAGATFISPFLGRLDDVGVSGINLVRDIAEIYQKGEYGTAILAASIRSAAHVEEAAKAGAHVATLPAKILEALYHHPLTDKGLEIFEADWKQTGQSIL